MYIKLTLKDSEKIGNLEQIGLRANVGFTNLPFFFFLLIFFTENIVLFHKIFQYFPVIFLNFSHNYFVFKNTTNQSQNS